jgi:hypothetical protein
MPEALTAGFSRALLAGSLFLVGAAVVALWAANSRGEASAVETVKEADPVPVK